MQKCGAQPVPHCNRHDAGGVTDLMKGGRRKLGGKFGSYGMEQSVGSIKNLARLACRPYHTDDIPIDDEDIARGIHSYSHRPVQACAYGWPAISGAVLVNVH